MAKGNAASYSKSLAQPGHGRGADPDVASQWVAPWLIPSAKANTIIPPPIKTPNRNAADTVVTGLKYGSQAGDSPSHADGGVFRSVNCDDPASYTGQTHIDASGNHVFDSGFLWCPVRE